LDGPEVDSWFPGEILVACWLAWWENFRSGQTRLFCVVLFVLVGSSFPSVLWCSVTHLIGMEAKRCRDGLMNIEDVFDLG